MTRAQNDTTVIVAMVLGMASITMLMAAYLFYVSIDATAGTIARMM